MGNHGGNEILKSIQNRVKRSARGASQRCPGLQGACKTGGKKCSLGLAFTFDLWANLGGGEAEAKLTVLRREGAGSKEVQLAKGALQGLLAVKGRSDVRGFFWLWEKLVPWGRRQLKKAWKHKKYIKEWDRSCPYCIGELSILFKNMWKVNFVFCETKPPKVLCICMLCILIDVLCALCYRFIFE